MEFSFARAAGKALGAHPALMDRSTPIAIYSPGRGSREQGAITQREASRHLQAYGGVEAIDWVMDCVRLYQDAISTAEYKLEKEDGTKLVRKKTPLTPDDHEVGPKELYELLDQPNPFMDYAEMVELLMLDLLLIGNGYWFKFRMNDEGRPLALYRMSPAHVKIIPSPGGPKRYEYQPPGAREPLKFSPDEIMHFRLPNPHSAYYGLGLIQGGGRMLDLEIAVTDRQASYYENAAEPSLILESERRIPRDIWNKLRAQLRARTAGTTKAGEMLALESGLKAKTLTPSARDQLFAELTRLSRDRIFAMFRISPLLMGILDETGGSNKISDARREFDTYVLRPFMDKLEKRVTERLAKAWGVKFQIDYRYILPLEELLKQGESVAKIPGIKVREVRRFYVPIGIEESTGDPDIDELIINMPGENLDEGGATSANPGFADQPLAGEPGRPPRLENTPTNRQVGQPGMAVRSGKALGLIHPDELKRRAGVPVRRKHETIEQTLERLSRLEGKAVVLEPPARTSIGRKLTGEQRPADPDESARDSAIDAAARAIDAELQNVAHLLERELLDHVEGKALSDLVQRIKRSPAWKTFARGLTRAISTGGTAAASTAAGSLADQGVPVDDVDYEAIIARMVNRREGITTMTRTLRDSVAAKVKEARDAGKSVPELQAIVSDAIAEWRSGKANVIALTEAVHIFNETTLDVLEDAGHTEVFVADGRDHDEPCVEADGSVWPIDHARENRLEHPNCRRAFLPMPAVN